MIGKVKVRQVPVSDYQEEQYQGFLIISAKSDNLYEIEVWNLKQKMSQKKPNVIYKGNSRPACIARAKKWVDKHERRTTTNNSGTA